MKKLDKIISLINSNKELTKKITNEEYYHFDQFINDANRYIKAIKERRMICSIGSVSSSGMSRTIKFLACEKNTHGYNYLNYFAFFTILGYSPVGRYGNYFRIGGCGTDMIFHTNYTIIHKLYHLGFINKKQCESFAQMTPQVI